MRIEKPRTVAQWSLWIEGGLLVAVTPFLLFPTFAINVTALSLALVGLLWLLPLLWRHWPWPPPTPFDLLLAGWCIVLSLSILVTADPQLTLPKATGLILGLAVWRFINRLIQSPALLVKAIAVWGLLAVGFVLLGTLSANWLDKVPTLASFVAHLPESVIILPESPELGVHTNQLAGTLLLIIPFLLSMLIGFYSVRPSRLKLSGWLLLTFTAVTLLLLTQSRTGWLAFAGTLFVLCLFWWLALPPDNRLRRMVGIAALGLAAIAFLAILLIGPNRLQTVWADPAQESALGSLGSISFRQEVWRWGITAVQDFPFTGTGLGSFRAVVRRLYPLHVDPSYDIAHAHNVFLQIALDVGLPGLVIYLAMVGLAFYLGMWVARQDEWLRPYTLGLLAGLAAVHLFGLADTLALGSKSHLLFWIMLGLITAMHRLTQVRWQKQMPVLSFNTK